MGGMLTGGREACVVCIPNFKPLACLVAEISAEKSFPIVTVSQGPTLVSDANQLCPKTCICLLYRMLYTNQAIQNQPKPNSCDGGIFCDTGTFCDAGEF